MTDLYLIAHKVRGEPAFDVASRIACPSCWEGIREDDGTECHECDGLGYWWIVPTSGHRAYPWWHLPLKIDPIEDGLRLIMDHNPTMLTWTIFPMPPDLPDHYATRAEPRIDLKAALGLNRPAQPTLPLPRRRI